MIWKNLAGPYLLEYLNIEVIGLIGNQIYVVEFR